MCNLTIAAFVVLSLSLGAPVAAQPVPAESSEQMQFHARPPRGPVEIFGNAWTIFADGVIDLDAGARLQRLIQEKNIPDKSWLVLNSPGGSVIGGINLGRAIRGAGLVTNVGRDSGDTSEAIVAGGCYSACTLAFLGGEYRYINKSSLYGVHRFSFTTKGNQDNDAAQILSASIVQYIRDMNVDPALFSEMTTAGALGLNILPHEKLAILNVVNNGQKKTYWTIECFARGIYMKGVRETHRGINKFILTCDKGSVGLYIIFDAQSRGDEIIKMMTAISLLIDGHEIPIAQRRLYGPGLTNGLVNAAFSLDGRLLDKIQRAKTVGVSFKHLYGSPVFMGFDGMDFDDGARQLPGFQRACHKE